MSPLENAVISRTERIKFSVIIPTYRRRGHLTDCLRGIARLEYPRSEFEVIVVDDGSGDPPTDVLASVVSEITVRLVSLPRNSGPATARNIGAEQARGTWLAFLDDDCIPEANWLSELEQHLQLQSRVLLGGGLKNAVPKNLPAEASHQLVSYLGDYYNVDPDNAEWFTSANIACARDAFRSIGGFGAGFPLAAAEDRDFCDRWHEAGFRLALAPDAAVGHARSMTLAQFLRQHHTYGRGAHYLHQARARRGAVTHRLEPARFYLGLVLHPLTVGAGWRAPLLILLLALSQVAYAAGYYGERIRAKRGVRTLAPTPSGSALVGDGGVVRIDRVDAPELIAAEPRSQPAARAAR